MLTDQRGGLRPGDGDGDSVATCDIGSYEYDPANDPLAHVYVPVVTLDDWEDLTIGFDIDDEDTGIGARGEPDDVCAGEISYDYEEIISGLVTERMIISRDDPPRCRVDFTIRPIGDTPIGSGGDDFPLPWIILEDVTQEPGDDRLYLHLRNIGSADLTQQ